MDTATEVKAPLQARELVWFKDKHELGICCLAKKTGKTFTVNVGKTDQKKNVSPDYLERVDLTGCRTELYSRYRRRVMMAEADEGFNKAIVGNELHHFVGIGWTVTGVVTEEDLRKYPIIIQDS